jgi:hypothetical protein
MFTHVGQSSKLQKDYKLRFLASADIATEVTEGTEKGEENHDGATKTKGSRKRRVSRGGFVWNFIKRGLRFAGGVIRSSMRGVR